MGESVSANGSELQGNWGQLSESCCAKGNDAVQEITPLRRECGPAVQSRSKEDAHGPLSRWGNCVIGVFHSGMGWQEFNTKLVR